MLDKDTVIRHPHAATKARGQKARIDDPRTSVAMQEEGATLTLFFDPDRAMAGDAALLEVRLEPAADGQFEPWRLLPRLPLHMTYARAILAWRHDDAATALDALRELGSTRRGLSDNFLSTVAHIYASLVAEGERYPIKALAAAQHVDKSTASRWVTTARQRGFLTEEER